MLVAFPDLLADLPQPTLGAVVIAASLSLADVAGMRRLYRQRRTDFVIAMAAFLGRRAARSAPRHRHRDRAVRGQRVPPRLAAVLGDPGTVDDLPGLHDTSSYPDAELLDGAVVLRFDAPLIFANAGTFRDEVLALADTDPAPQWIIVAAEPMTDVDTTACDMLEDLVTKLDARGVRFVFAELKDPARKKIEQFGLEHVLDDSRFYPTITAATGAFQSATGRGWRAAQGDTGS